MTPLTPDERRRLVMAPFRSQVFRVAPKTHAGTLIQRDIGTGNGRAYAGYGDNTSRGATLEDEKYTVGFGRIFAQF